MILAFSMATIAITAFGPILITAIHGTPALTVGYIIACSSIGWTVLAVAVSGAPVRLDGRMAGAIPTVSRLGYALGAAYLGIVANASGFLAMETTAEAAFVAKVIFLSCLPLAAIGFWALGGFMRAGPGGR